MRKTLKKIRENTHKNWAKMLRTGKYRKATRTGSEAKKKEDRK